MDEYCKSLFGTYPTIVNARLNCFLLTLTIYRQFDLREPHDCSPNDRVQLIDLQTHMGPGTEVKCIAVNQRRPEQLAVGATDNYARIFDLRMIRVSPVSSNLLN